MDFLDWVRGPLLTLSLVIFVAGVAWRLLALWRLPHRVAPGAPERQPSAPVRRWAQRSPACCRVAVFTRAPRSSP